MLRTARLRCVKHACQVAFSQGSFFHAQDEARKRDELLRRAQEASERVQRAREEAPRLTSDLEGLHTSLQEAQVRLEAHSQAKRSLLK